MKYTSIWLKVASGTTEKQQGFQTWQKYLRVQSQAKKYLRVQSQANQQINQFQIIVMLFLLCPQISHILS